MATCITTTPGARPEETTYNGWSNYETWAVALWLDNEASTYEYVRGLARDAWDDASPTTYATRGQAAAWALAETLKDEHEDANPLADEDVPASVFSDLLSASLGRVDWHEIAHNLVTEVLCELEPDEDDEPTPSGSVYAQPGGLLDEFRMAEAVLGGEDQ